MIQFIRFASIVLLVAFIGCRKRVAVTSQPQAVMMGHGGVAAQLAFVEASNSVGEKRALRTMIEEVASEYVFALEQILPAEIIRLQELITIHENTLSRQKQTSEKMSSNYFVRTPLSPEIKNDADVLEQIFALQTRRDGKEIERDAAIVVGNRKQAEDRQSDVETLTTVINANIDAVRLERKKGWKKEKKTRIISHRANTLDVVRDYVTIAKMSQMTYSNLLEAVTHLRRSLTILQMDVFTLKQSTGDGNTSNHKRLQDIDVRIAATSKKDGAGVVSTLVEKQVVRVLAVIDALAQKLPQIVVAKNNLKQKLTALNRELIVMQYLLEGPLTTAHVGHDDANSTSSVEKMAGQAKQKVLNHLTALSRQCENLYQYRRNVEATAKAALHTHVDAVMLKLALGGRQKRIFTQFLDEIDGRFENVERWADRIAPKNNHRLAVLSRKMAELKIRDQALQQGIGQLAANLGTESPNLLARQQRAASDVLVIHLQTINKEKRRVTQRIESELRQSKVGTNKMVCGRSMVSVIAEQWLERILFRARSNQHYQGIPLLPLMDDDVRTLFIRPLFSDEICAFRSDERLGKGINSILLKVASIRQLVQELTIHIERIPVLQLHSRLVALLLAEGKVLEDINILVRDGQDEKAGYLARLFDFTYQRFDLRRVEAQITQEFTSLIKKPTPANLALQVAIAEAGNFDSYTHDVIFKPLAAKAIFLGYKGLPNRTSLKLQKAMAAK